jgi:hypothetical protein
MPAGDTAAGPRMLPSRVVDRQIDSLRIAGRPGRSGAAQQLVHDLVSGWLNPSRSQRRIMIRRFAEMPGLIGASIGGDTAKRAFFREIGGHCRCAECHRGGQGQYRQCAYVCSGQTFLPSLLLIPGLLDRSGEFVTTFIGATIGVSSLDRRPKPAGT